MIHERVQGFLKDDDEVGRRMGRYRVVREVGRGGTAVVYEAHDPTLDRKVAIKHIKEDNLARLRQEALAAARLRHPNIIPVLEVGEDFIVMDLSDGRSLSVMMADMPLDERLRVLEDVARAMAYAHGQGVVHRDLKPSNVLVEANGRVLVTDFGLAKIMGGDDLTMTGAVVGTPQYMAPEQVRGKELTPATDVWALGVMLYEMVSGARPFDAPTGLAIFDRVVRHDPPPLAGPLGAIALKAMEKEPARRYASAEAFADELARYRRAQPVRASRLWPRLRRHAWAVGWFGAAALVLATVWIAALLFGSAGRSPNAAAPGRTPGAPGLDRASRVRVLAAEEHRLTERMAGGPVTTELLSARSDVRRARARLERRLCGDPLPHFATALEDLDQALALAPDDETLRLARAELRADRIGFLVDGRRDPGADCSAALADLADGRKKRVRLVRATVRAHCAYAAVSPSKTPSPDVGAALDRALADLDPAWDADSAARRGWVLSLLGRFAEADDAFSSSVRANPDNEGAWMDWGQARLLAGDAEGGRRHLDEAVKRSPDDARAWELHGDAALTLGDFAGAAADYERAIAACPAREPLVRDKLREARRRASAQPL
jgi:tetratricopeptide (TPR) repeat protein/predicted Ser/Thr protein kinase